MTKKILLIEDDRIIRENTAELLQLAGYWVEAYSDGKMGLAMAKLQLPDLIICDILIPKLSGYDVLLYLKQEATTKHIPFVFLTAKSEKTDLKKGIEFGAKEYITKPFHDTELLNTIALQFQTQKPSPS